MDPRGVRQPSKAAACRVEDGETSTIWERPDEGMKMVLLVLRISHPPIP